MNSLFLLWLSLSLSGSIVAGLIFLLRPILGRLGKTWQYYIWLLVLLRLLIPFSPDVSLVGSLFHQLEAQLVSQNAPAPIWQDGTGAELAAVPEQTGDGWGFQEAGRSTSFFTGGEDHIWGILWLAVAMVLLVRKLHGYRQFVGAVKKESRPVSGGEPAEVLAETARAMGIRKEIAVYTNPLVGAPMMMAGLRPAVVLPEREFQGAELTYVFRHELSHYRRRDFLYKWLAEVTVCLHWFNPLVYWVRRELNCQCELSCDEGVIASMDEQERRDYGEMLLGFIAVNTEGKGPAVSLRLSEDGRLMKERLSGIMRYRKKSRFTVVLAVMLTLLLCFGTVFAGSYTAKEGTTVKTTADAGLMVIDTGVIAPKGKISLGEREISSGTKCLVSLSFRGSGKLTVLCTAPTGAIKSYLVESGKETAFQVEGRGAYTIAIKNTNAVAVKDVKGSVLFQEKAVMQQGQNVGSAVTPLGAGEQKVIYEYVEMRYYDGSIRYPYAHDARRNSTTQKIIATQRGMLAFDKDGNPLKIKWNGLDSDSKASYHFLYDWDETEILPGATYDIRGGWSLNMEGDDANVKKIAYILYCDKQITFGDGTLWENPNYKKWLETYEGKKADTAALKSYYPYEQKIQF